MEKHKCVDFYNLKLEVGQEVIPICSDALLADIKGIISKTEYSEFYNVWFIDISDNNGNVLLKGVNPKYYTTQERFDKMENDNYVYSISFYDEQGKYLNELPLTQVMDEDYEIPKDISYVTLREKVVLEQTEHHTAISTNVVGLFTSKEKVRMSNFPGDFNTYLFINNTNDFVTFFNPDSCIKEFDSNDDLNEYIKSIIKSFSKEETVSIGLHKISCTDDIKKSTRQYIYKK